MSSPQRRELLAKSQIFKKDLVPNRGANPNQNLPESEVQMLEGELRDTSMPMTFLIESFVMGVFHKMCKNLEI